MKSTKRAGSTSVVVSSKISNARSLAGAGEEFNKIARVVANKHRCAERRLNAQSDLRSFGLEPGDRSIDVGDTKGDMLVSVQLDVAVWLATGGRQLLPSRGWNNSILSGPRISIAPSAPDPGSWKRRATKKPSTSPYQAMAASMSGTLTAP